MAEVQHISLVAYARQPMRAAMPRMINLSHGALVVRTNSLLKVGQSVDVTLYFVELDREIQIKAEVVWANSELSDMALRFVDLSEDGVAAIADFLGRNEES